ncbi:amidohydrolase family protein [Maribacter chungangensis]|uniref:Amidohydrolase family protein n=1 Tax=Maribacter chungangensis TaxID=1069117 RepID=A0ABW3B8Y9_9FLAO
MKTKLIFLFVLAFVSCKQNSKGPNAKVKAIAKNNVDKIDKIDIHSHFRYDTDYLKSFMDNNNMKAVLVDVAQHNTDDSTKVNRSWDNYLALSKQYPDIFLLCSSLIGIGIDDPKYTEKEISRLKKEIRQGAKMVKVWKNFGMITKDASGKFIQIDDVRLQPIWDFLSSENIPVMAHIGEPLQAWTPLDPKNPHFSYYKNNPQYHAYTSPEVPSYETIIAARDKWAQNNSNLKILGAHNGSMSHDVDMIAERLDKFPNFNIELAARFGDLVRQDSDKVKAFFEQYQNRIHFGTDFGNYDPPTGMSPEERKKEEQDLKTGYDQLHLYLSSTDTVEIRGQVNKGLGLSTEVLHKIYVTNTINFLEL